MRGTFDKIIGKTISAVYCRENENMPAGQIFLVFDDDTHFEIYAAGPLKGANGVDKGDIEVVTNLNHPSGKGEVFVE